MSKTSDSGVVHNKHIPSSSLPQILYPTNDIACIPLKL